MNFLLYYLWFKNSLKLIRLKNSFSKALNVIYLLFDILLIFFYYFLIKCWYVACYFRNIAFIHRILFFKASFPLFNVLGL